MRGTCRYGKRDLFMSRMSTFESTHRAAPTGVIRGRLSTLWFALAMVLAVSFSAIVSLPAAAQGTGTATATEETTTTGNDLSVADVAEQANPAVVTIYTFVSGQSANGLIPMQPGSVPNQQTDPNEEQPLGAGSGWIYDEAGHVITNAHVVNGATSFKVQFQDGTEVDATLVGTDTFQDVAVLKLDLAEGQEVPGVATVGDSSTVRAGDRVVALGTPLGEFANSVSEGIIGGLDRALDTGAGYELGNLIQHDAPLSSGNSGGPLLNMQGEVIGMNVAAIGNQNQLGTSQSVSSGLGFAIDGNTVVNIAETIITNNGDVVYPYLGIESQTTADGQVIVAVVPDSPAAQSGLQPGDIITAIDGAELSEDNLMINALFSHQPGDTATLTIQRDGESHEISVTLGERPADV
jgi:2-alkenal reductase